MFPKFDWLDSEADEKKAWDLAAVLKVPPPIARLLVARGVGEPDTAAAFLSPDLKTHITEPLAFPGVRDAVDRLWSAIRSKRDILVFGDFDADGVAAAAIISIALRRMGGQVEVFLPVRDIEGYGLSFAAIERCFAERGRAPSLLLTVDCGVSSVAEVAHLKQLGVEVIISDHHEPGAELPRADVIVNPRLGASPGAEELCGAGVAFKISHALVEAGRRNGWYSGAALGGELLVPAGLATVADVVPLTGENRVLVWSAIKHWSRFAGLGLRALLSRAAQTTVTAPDAYTFGYILGPRINAAGRMASAMAAYELLTTRDKDRATELAAQLEGLNGRRKGIEDRILVAACRQCGLDKADAAYGDPAVVVGGNGSHAGEEGWHPGVIGIVASRLRELTGRPAAVVSFDAGGYGRGSVRVGEGYHALDALSAAGEALDRFGGHARAAGFDVKPGAFDLFKRLFYDACTAQSASGGHRLALTVDGWLETEDLSYDFYREQQRMAPFGHGNPTPRWGVRGVVLTDAKPMGSTGAHLQMTLKRKGRLLPRGVWFRTGCPVERLRGHGGLFDVVFELRENCFGGAVNIEINVVDMAPSKT
ncbi:MAG: DHH family phosphoesterase [Kiritimatiellae bacterium]|nr:DHH family phosphoesterase [Kiritimatiellia bacterium]